MFSPIFPYFSPFSPIFSYFSLFSLFSPISPCFPDFPLFLPVDLTPACSHMRVLDLMIESIDNTNCRFVALRKCTDHLNMPVSATYMYTPATFNTHTYIYIYIYMLIRLIIPMVLISGLINKTKCHVFW